MARRLHSCVSHLIAPNVVVIGGALAGTSAAIKAREKGLKVTLYPEGLHAVAPERALNPR